jgi:hypothetical protein
MSLINHFAKLLSKNWPVSLGVINMSWFPGFGYLMIHSSVMSTYRCGIVNVVMEMDRILRPDGWAIFRDRVQVLREVEDIVKCQTLLSMAAPELILNWDRKHSINSLLLSTLNLSFLEITVLMKLETLKFQHAVYHQDCVFLSRFYL